MKTDLCKKASLKMLCIVTFYLVAVFFNNSAFANYKNEKIGENINQLNMLSVNDSGCIMEILIGDFQRKEIKIDEDGYNLLSLSIGTLIQEMGYPELPKISRSIMIPQGKNFSYKVTEQEFEMLSLKVAPSKGSILRDVNPDSVKYVFNQVYQENRYYPENLVETDKPYFIRNFQGVKMDIFPFSYNHYTGLLKVYTRLVIEITFEGLDRTDPIKITNKYFEPILKNHFLNYSQQTSKYRSVNDEGKMLVIAYDDFMGEMEPFVQHKNSTGLSTELVSISDIGTSANDIKSFIQDYYNNDNSLTFVLLVGDNAQVPTKMVYGGGSDPSYSLVSGTDNYPDIIIGRFSAETTDQVKTMVNRSINYTKNNPSFHNAIGIASNQGPGDDAEYDWEHQRNIRTGLLNWHYTNVDELYDGSQGGDDAPGDPTPGMISECINNGVSLINYTGHGSGSAWSTSGFSTSDINMLTNDNKLPFIFSVSCKIGNFTGMTCFCEAWLRAENSFTGSPTGAIGIYGSTINQPWYPPMQAQDEFNSLLVKEQYATFGSLCYNSSISMIDEYGTMGERTFLTWHIFGDPSINVLPENTLPQDIKIQFMTYSTSQLTNSISVNFRIFNTGITDVDLADVSARYYYNYEGTAQNEIANVYWTGILPSGTNITSKVNTNIESAGTDRIYTISFDSDAGIIKPGEYVECQTRFNKVDWSNYNQSNDFSFAPVFNYQDWEKTAGFINGVLVWGTTP